MTEIMTNIECDEQHTIHYKSKRHQIRINTHSIGRIHCRYTPLISKYGNNTYGATLSLSTTKREIY